MAVDSNSASSRYLNFKLSEGLILAIAPGLAYLFVFVYQLGYAYRLGIPTDFIQVEVRDVLVATIVIAIVLTQVVSVADLGSPWIRKLDRPGKEFAAIVLVAASILIVPQMIIGIVGGFPALMLAMAAMSLVLLVPFLTPIWSQRTVEGGYWSKLEAQRIKEAKRLAEHPTVTSRLSTRLNLPLGLIFAGTIAVFLLAHSFGQFEAVTKKEFLTLPKSKEVVLATYGEKMIIAPFDGHRIQRSFRVIRLGGDSSEQFHLERIGRLKPMN